MHALDLREGAVLERGAAYLIPLEETLHLPPRLRGKANPRSSTGRLDIFTRLVTDHTSRFDEVSDGYHGPLYVQVISRSFSLRVQAGVRLNQLRLLCGTPTLPDGEIQRALAETPLLVDGDGPLGARAIVRNDGLFLRVSLTGVGDTDLVGFRAKKTGPLLDVTQVHAYRIQDFWEPVFCEDTGGLTLDPEEFYLLRSTEKVRLPPEYAANLVAYDPASGELRTHYAGFFDPGFGHGERGELQGTAAVLEVRAHDVPFRIEHGQPFCRLQLERMASPPDAVYGPQIGSAYQCQDLTPSKHFRPLEIQEVTTRAPIRSVALEPSGD
jgi:dCTP deaminase